MVDSGAATLQRFNQVYEPALPPVTELDPDSVEFWVIDLALTWNIQLHPIKIEIANTAKTCTDNRKRRLMPAKY
jgi:hypothetical protein